MPNPDEIKEFGGYEGLGCSLSMAAELRFGVELARAGGIIPDSDYTGKAFKGMWVEVDGRRRNAERILFVHAGGRTVLDAYADAFTDLESSSFETRTS